MGLQGGWAGLATISFNHLLLCATIRQVKSSGIHKTWELWGSWGGVNPPLVNPVLGRKIIAFKMIQNDLVSKKNVPKRGPKALSVLSRSCPLSSASAQCFACTAYRVLGHFCFSPQHFGTLGPRDQNQSAAWQSRS